MVSRFADIQDGTECGKYQLAESQKIYYQQVCTVAAGEYSPYYCVCLITPPPPPLPHKIMFENAGLLLE